jgi:hypothetical protein
MRRTRIERLEERKLFSVTDLIIDPFQAQVAASATTNQPPATVDYLDQDDISTSADVGRSKGSIIDNDQGVWTDRITATYNGDGTFNIVGDFNGDGVDDLATFTVDSRPETAALHAERNQDIEVENDETHFVERDDASGIVAGNFIGVDDVSNLIIVVCSRAPGENLLPYMEQDNLYKLSDRDNSDTQSFLAALYTDLLGRPVNVARLDSITDGSSNTLMLSESVPPVDLDLLGAMVDTSPIELSVVSLDTWEHGSSFQAGRGTNGIIAILIGLAADPSDPTGDTASGLSIGLDDVSPRFIGTDVTGTADLGNALPASPEFRSNRMAMLLGSDEYFAKFSNTTLDDEALVATTYGRGLEAANLTHDVVFENWARGSQFDRGYLPPGIKMSDLLVSSIRAGR